jgi:hypothetical protein
MQKTPLMAAKLKEVLHVATYVNRLAATFTPQRYNIFYNLVLFSAIIFKISRIYVVKHSFSILYELKKLLFCIQK